jgi:GNAT superfamily N-acetyltransferase
MADRDALRWRGDEIEWVRRGKYLEVDSIYLKADQQRRGIGTKLLKRLIQEADRSHVPLRLSTAKINPARRLYERLGFSVEREDEFKIRYTP